MRVVCYGYTTLTAASQLVFQPVTPQHLRRITQCPGLITQCPGLILQRQEVNENCLKTMKMHPEITPMDSLVM